MTVFEKIIEAIKPFDLPHAPDIYTGKKKSYFTYNYSDDRGLGFGDDGCDLSVAYIQVHFFLPIKENFIEKKKQIRDRLVMMGFTYPSIRIVTEEDRGLRHLVFECEIEEE